MQPSNSSLKPVTIIGGFLGAGKTTYLNEQIQQGKVASTALILVNDFGSINVDYALLEESEQNVVQLSNGCICCSLRGSLADQLYQLEAEPWFESITEVYIETSGVSRPKPILDTLTLSKCLEKKAWITVIDMSQSLRWYKDQTVTDIWQQQIQLADRLILNRCDDERAKALVETLRKKSGEVRYVRAQELQPTQPLVNSQRVSGRVISMQHNRIITATLTSLQIPDKQSFERCCQVHVSTLLRAKGLVCVKGEDYLVQVSGSSVTWYSPPRTLSKQLVIIGKKSEQFDRFIETIQSISNQIAAA